MSKHKLLSTVCVLLTAAALVVVGKPSLSAVKAVDDAEDKVIEAVKKLGGKVVHEDNDAEKPIVKVDLKGAKTTDEDLKELAPLLADLKELKELDLSGAKVTDEGLKELVELKGLKELVLKNTKATTEGVAELKKALPDLKVAGVAADAEEKVVEAVKKLRGKVVHEDDDAEKPIVKVDLKGTKATDEDLKELAPLLAELKELKELDLEGCKGVTDEGLKELAELKGLKELDLKNTKVTAEAAAELKKALPDLKVAGAGGDGERKMIDEYLKNLNYDVDKVLSVNGKESRTKLAPLPEKNEYQGRKLIQIKETKYSLDTNMEGVAILNPTNGVIYPGALLKANDQLVKGTPQAVTALGKGERNGVVLTIDLPNFSKYPEIDAEKKGIVVKDPTNATISDAVDAFLTWYFDPKNDNGDIPAARFEMLHTTAHSEEQASLDLGLNMNSGANKLKSSFSLEKNSETDIEIAKFQQTYFTVTINQPDRTDLIGNEATLAETEKAFDANSPPCYVQSISYGRIVLVKLEKAKSNTDIDFKAAFESMKVGGDIDAKNKSALENAKAKVIIIGGNPKTGADVAIEPKDAEKLANCIRDGAVMSKESRGVPIAYNVFFLKDHRLAKMGFNTEYTTAERKEFDEGLLKFIMTPDAWMKITYEVEWEEFAKKADDTWGFEKKSEKHDLDINSEGEVRLGAMIKNLNVKVHVHGFRDVWLNNPSELDIPPQNTPAAAPRKQIRMWGSLFGAGKEIKDAN